MQILPVIMTSLPMAIPFPVLELPLSGPEASAGNGIIEDEQFLLRAFRSFAEAASSLERSYGRLRSEVARLRRELEASNSDLARSLEENRAMRVHLDKILESLPCGILVVTNNNEISKANPEAVRLLGADNAAILASISDLPATTLHLLECARRKQTEQELSVGSADNSVQWLAARHASLENHTSIFILSDVTERKRLEEVQARLRREQVLAEISSILAHEIRNPLGSLELFAGLLAEAQINPECRAWVEHLQAGLRTLSATANNVLHFHSLPEPACTPVDMGRLIEWAHDFFMPLARRAGITISLQNCASGIFLPADRHRLEQVLLNLVLNSMHAMPGGGWIQLTVRKVENGNAVALVVADTGPGISPENLPRIFEPGFSTKAGSPGLGLAVCRKIMEQHEGTIEAANRNEFGASFTITFPLTKRSCGVAE